MKDGVSCGTILMTAYFVTFAFMVGVLSGCGDNGQDKKLRSSTVDEVHRQQIHSSDLAPPISAFYDRQAVPLPHPGCPLNPKQTLQPTSPGSYWDYRLTVHPSTHQCCRMFAIEKWPDLLVASEGVLAPRDGLLTGVYNIRFTVTDSLKVLSLPGLGEGYFFKVLVENTDTRQVLPMDGEQLYWGRVALEEPFGTVAVCELRQGGSAITEIKAYHLRMLTLDCLYISDREVCFRKGKSGEDYRCSFETDDKLIRVMVPAGEFQCVATTFTFIFDLYGHRFRAVETLYYANQVGLVKWTQKIKGSQIEKDSFEMVLNAYRIVPEWPIKKSQQSDSPDK